MPEHPHLDRIIAEACQLGPVRVAVTYPCSTSAIEAAMTASRLGLIEPVLVGPRARIEAIAREKAIDLAAAELIETGEDPAEAAIASVALCREGRAHLIMKGSLHSDELLAAVVGRDGGLRTSRRTSHAFVFDLPHYPKPLLMADCVVNISPGLIDKRDITQNAIELAHSLGIARPYVGILSAVETINPAIPGTVEAAALSKMAQRGQITGAIVDGPLAFDIAISIEAARIKGIELPSAERPDILIVPNLEAGNILYKQLVYLAKAECAGIVLGTTVPIILTSRADSEKCRVASCALAVLHARHRSPSRRTA
ncbi:MAG: bifunctional enoyl-CoA hydratase/phosphate acetyltransferase [Hyphomonadaceae bacterium]|nr:bifunctional enoyl-CoA hydratase/phosphate acetyltransferase [Hyphomonadaceae bacterium]